MLQQDCYNIEYHIKAQFYSLTALKDVFIHLTIPTWKNSRFTEKIH